MRSRKRQFEQCFVKEKRYNVAITFQSDQRDKFPEGTLVMPGWVSKRVHVHSYAMDGLGKVAILTAKAAPSTCGPFHARQVIKFLDQLGVEYECDFNIITSIRSEEEERNLMKGLLSRLPALLIDWVLEIKDSDKRYLLVLRDAEGTFRPSEEYTCIQALSSYFIIMLDCESEAIRLKMAHGGEMYDMEELRRGS